MAVNTMTAVFCQVRALTLRRSDYKAQRMLSLSSHWRSQSCLGLLCPPD